MTCATAQFIEEQILASLREALPCVAAQVKLSASSSPVDCLVTGDGDGGRFNEAGRDPEEVGTVYLPMSKFTGLQADQKIYIIFSGAGTAQTFRVTQTSYKARAIVRLDYQSIHGGVRS
jgi:hypothetical protein